MERKGLTNVRDICAGICLAGRMSKKSKRSQKPLVLTEPAEAAVVNRIEVRLVRPEEEAEWNRLMEENHYLKSAQMVGEQLRYVAEYEGDWMALLGWSAAAYHLKGREGWIGWQDNQRRARLHLVAK